MELFCQQYFFRCIAYISSFAAYTLIIVMKLFLANALWQLILLLAKRAKVSILPYFLSVYVSESLQEKLFFLFIFSAFFDAYCSFLLFVFTLLLILRYFLFYFLEK
jgi:hypothetical protein